MDTQTFVSLGLVVLFVMFGGVFAATEIALVSLRDSQITQLSQQGPRGARVAEVARNPNRFLAAVQIGVTVAGFFSAAYGGSTLAPDVAPYLENLGLPEDAASTTALVLMTLLIAYLSLVLGELVPKRLALQKAAPFATLVAPPLDRFATLMRPAIWLLSVSTDALVRLLGGDATATSEEVSEEELRELVSTHEGLRDEEKRIVGDVFAARTTSLKEVMRPRGEVDFVAADEPLVEAARRIRDLPHSRYPVMDDGFDDIVGFLHVRDLLGVGDDDRRVVRDVAREVLRLPSTNKVLPTVGVMRQRGIHLAVLVDEYGGTDGIVTLEDLVEEIVGEIRDEYDPPEAAEGAHGVSSYDAGLSIEDFAELTGVHLPDGDYETVAGHVISQLGRIAEVGDAVEVVSNGRAYRIEVAATAGTRLTRVTLVPVAHPQPDTQGA